MSETRDQTSGRNFGWIRSNVAVDLDVDNDILPASLCSPSACSVGAAGCDPPPGPLLLRCSFRPFFVSSNRRANEHGSSTRGGRVRSESAKMVKNQNYYSNR